MPTKSRSATPLKAAEHCSRAVDTASHIYAANIFKKSSPVPTPSISVGDGALLYFELRLATSRRRPGRRPRLRRGRTPWAENGCPRPVRALKLRASRSSSPALGRARSHRRPRWSIRAGLSRAASMYARSPSHTRAAECRPHDHRRYDSAARGARTAYPTD